MHNDSGEMQADIFEVILSFLGPKDACSLASVSRTFRNWVDSSVMWEEWCEKACPSIKDPPAKTFVEALYGANAKAGRSYKQLFLDLKRSLHRKPSHYTEQRSETCSEILFDIRNHVMLMDVYVSIAGKEGVLSCSADGRFLANDPKLGKGHFCLEPIEVVCSPGLDKMLCASFNKCFHYLETAGNKLRIEGERLESRLITFSWKLLRKSDGKIQNLLKRETCFTANGAHINLGARNGSYGQKEGWGCVGSTGVEIARDPPRGDVLMAFMWLTCDYQVPAERGEEHWDDSDASRKYKISAGCWI
jgi:hypothetical protein